MKPTTFRHLWQYVTLLSDTQRGSPQPEQPLSSWRSMLSATAIYPSETGDHMVLLYPVYTLHKRDAAAAPRHHNDARDGGEVERGEYRLHFSPPCMSKDAPDNPSPPPAGLTLTPWGETSRLDGGRTAFRVHHIGEDVAAQPGVYGWRDGWEGGGGEGNAGSLSALKTGRMEEEEEDEEEGGGGKGARGGSAVNGALPWTAAVRGSSERSIGGREKEKGREGGWRGWGGEEVVVKGGR